MYGAAAITVATQEKNCGDALEDTEGAVHRAEDSRAAAAFTSPVKAVVRERADADDDVLTQKMADSLAQARACGRRGVEALRANELEKKFFTSHRPARRVGPVVLAKDARARA